MTKILSRTALATLLAVGASSCNRSNQPTSEPASTDESTETATSSATSGQPAPSVNDIEATQMHSALTQFSLATLDQLMAATPGENVVASPLSIHATIAMLLAGADGELAGNVADALLLGDEFRADREATIAALGEALQALDPSESSSVTFEQANRVWFNQHANAVSSDYLSTISAAFDAQPGDVDFAGDPDAARQVVNAWVSDQTNERIPELLKAGDVDASTALVLTNAVYFLADWASPFTADSSTPQPFHTAGGETVEVEMMQKLMRNLTTWSGEGFRAVELPYAGRDYSMVLVLPNEDVDDTRDQLREAYRTGALIPSGDARERRSVALALPKFEIRWRQQLNDTLTQLGMGGLFVSPTNLSRMFDTGSYVVDTVVHEAWIKVDEKGTEAAAATGAAVRLTSMPIADEPLVMRFDRPFYFAITHASTGTPLFTGYIANPVAE